MGHKKYECKINPAMDANKIAFTVHDGSKQAWLLDSGASSHMTPAKEDFSEYYALKNPIEVLIADGAKMEAIVGGKIRFRCKSGTKW